MRLRRFLRRRPDGSVWLGSFADGTSVASASAVVATTHLYVAIEGGSVTRDPELLPAVCDWCEDQGIRRVVVAVDGACDSRLVAAAGLEPGADYVTYSRALDAADARRTPSSRVREVAVVHPEVSRLAEERLPAIHTGYRPSGTEVLAGAAVDPSARAWVVGSPAVGCVVTSVTGDAGMIALIACRPGSAGRLADDLLAAALSAFPGDGAATMNSVVETRNEPSRALNVRYGMEQTGRGSWWHRGPSDVRPSSSGRES